MQQRVSNGSLIRLDDSNKDEYFDFWLETYQHPEVNPFFFKPMDMPRDKMRALYEAYIANPLTNFFIYEDEFHKPIGNCRVTFFDGARSHVAMVNAFGINPKSAGHSKGYGSQMLAAVEDFVKQHPRKVTQIELAYEGDNIRGRGFYEKKFGYQLQLNYEDWWHRKEEQFKKKYSWYTEERCCVKFLTSENSDMPYVLAKVKPLQRYDLDDCFSVASDFEQHEIEKIISSYSVKEQEEIRRIISNSAHEIFVLKDDNGIRGLICFKPYTDIRLDNAVTIPCVLLDNELSSEMAASFIDKALVKYRNAHPAVFHFACSEEDTEDLFYGSQMSKINVLFEVLQMAGFESVGVFKNYYDQTSFVGRDLLGFQCCFLGLQDAIRCVQSSQVLNTPEKIKLTAALEEILGTESELSRYDQWMIFKMVRYVAYPQDYTSDEKIQKIESIKTIFHDLKDLILGIARKDVAHQSAFDFMARKESPNLNQSRDGSISVLETKQLK